MFPLRRHDAGYDQRGSRSPLSKTLLIYVHLGRNARWLCEPSASGNRIWPGWASKTLFSASGRPGSRYSQNELRGIILCIWVARPSDVARRGHLGDPTIKTRAQLQDTGLFSCCGVPTCSRTVFFDQLQTIKWKAIGSMSCSWALLLSWVAHL